MLHAMWNILSLDKGQKDENVLPVCGGNSNTDGINQNKDINVLFQYIQQQQQQKKTTAASERMN